MPECRTCKECGEEKSADDFLKSRYQCKKCAAARMRQYRKDNPGRMKLIDKRKYDKERAANLEYCQRRDKNKHLRQTFGLSIDQYEMMLAAQDGRCALCGMAPEPGRQLGVDHNHKTEQIRALLCSGCNWHAGWVEQMGAQNLCDYFAKYEDM